MTIARTDALARDWWTWACDRALRYADADVLWIEAPTSAAELETVATQLSEHTGAAELSRRLN